MKVKVNVNVEFDLKELAKEIGIVVDADNNMSLNGVPVTEQNIKDTVSDWMDNLLLDGMEFNERDEDGDLLSYIGEMFDDDEDMFIETLLDFAAE